MREREGERERQRKRGREKEEGEKGERIQREEEERKDDKMLCVKGLTDGVNKPHTITHTYTCTESF